MQRPCRSPQRSSKPSSRRSQSWTATASGANGGGSTARTRHDISGGIWLVLAIAWKLQEKVHGGLTAAQKRKLAGIAEDLKKNGNLSAGPAIRLKPGLRLVREWRGETHDVLVLEDGFEWNGERRHSLSAIAREITGTQWSGPRFFGLQPRPKPFSGEERADA